MLGVAGSVTNSCDITHKLVSNQGSAIFDGTNDFISCGLPSGSSFISKTQGSISLWARVTATSNNETFWNCCVGSVGTNKISLIYNTNGGKIQAQVKAAGTTKSAGFAISNSAIVSAGWFHVCMTYQIDASAYVIKLYYNGSLKSTQVEELDHNFAEDVTLNTVHLGKNAVTTNTYHQGYIDEYAYFTRVLTADEVSDINAAKGFFNYAEDLTLTGTSNALTQWLRFGDGSVQGTKDQTTGIVDMSNNSLGSELANFSDSNIVFNNLSDSTTISLGSNSYRSEGFGNTNDARPRVQINGTSIVTGKIYKVIYNPTAFTGSTVFDFFENGTRIINNHDASVSKEFYFTASDSTDGFDFDGSQTFRSDYTLSVKEVQGNPAFASGALINQDNLPG